MGEFSQYFNTFSGVLSSASVAIPFAVATGLALWKGPRQLTPENGVARVITARNFPNIFSKGKIVAKNGAQMYLNWGASDVNEIPLNTFRVAIERKGKDSALTLADKVKAEVNAEFFVRVDTSSDASIIQALESLGGKIDETQIREYCTPKFDAALRAAAAKMQIESIQTDRESFRASVKEALDSLKDDGLMLVDVSLRQLNQSPLDDFDENSAFDAQGLQKITEIIEVSRRTINDKRQEAATGIQARNKDEAIRRLTIEREQQEATLLEEERRAQLEAEKTKRVAEITAKTTQEAETARISAERTVAEARLAQEEQLGIAEVNKQRAVAVAREESERITEEAKLARRVALHAKAGEEAAAEKLANEQRAEAVAAEANVVTARQVAEAERTKRIEVITAETAAEKAAASERIAAQTRVLVAQKANEEATARAQAVEIEAKAAQTAAELSAKGDYEEIFQRLKAQADGKSALAEAQTAENDALNKLSPDALKHLIELARVKMTPEAIREAMKAAEKIGDIRITSVNGVGGAFGQAAGGSPTSVPSVPGDPMSQMVQSMMTYRLAQPLLDEIIAGVGGDREIARYVPGKSMVPAIPLPRDPVAPVPAPAAPAPMAA